MFLCATYCNGWNCDHDHCRDCGTDEECPKPPSPPVSPPASPPPMIPPHPPQMPSPRCTLADQIGASCMETRCCENPEHTCFRKRGQRGSQFGYAVCMISCPEGGDWDCEEIALPPPTPPADVAVVDESSMASRICSERFEPCLETQCCASEFDGCFHRAGRRFAMCKPLQPYMATGACVGDGTWECPGWEAPSTLSLASPPWPPVPHAVEIPRTQLATPESEDDVVGDIGSGVLMFESSSGEFPSAKCDEG